MAIICANVLTLPTVATLTWERCPAADDDGGGNREPRTWIGLHQEDQRHGHQELVGDRVEECAEARGLLQAPGEKAVQPVRQRAGGEDHGGGGVRPVIRKIENQYENRYQKYAYQGKAVGKIHYCSRKAV
jgi:hypothetical protein